MVLTLLLQNFKNFSHAEIAKTELKGETIIDPFLLIELSLSRLLPEIAVFGQRKQA